MPPTKLPLAARRITSRGRPSRGFGALSTPAAARAPGPPAHLSGTGDRSAPPPIPCAGTRDPCAPAGSGPRSAPPACPPRTRRSSRLIRSGPRTRRAKGSGHAHQRQTTPALQRHALHQPCPAHRRSRAVRLRQRHAHSPVMPRPSQFRPRPPSPGHARRLRAPPSSLHPSHCAGWGGVGWGGGVGAPSPLIT